METEILETKIKAWREGQGLTVKQGAKLLGISKSYMSMLESGDRTPSADKRIQIEELTEGFVAFKDWPTKDSVQ